jgi:hypothetical protein
MGTGDGFDAISNDLREGATSVRSAIEPVSGFASSDHCPSGSAYGSDELASMFTSFTAAVDQAVTRLDAAAKVTASQLDASANAYDTTDQSVASLFVGPPQPLGPVVAK